MLDSMDALLKEFVATSSGTQEEIKSVEDEFGVSLPEDYQTFLRTSGGGEGFIGEQYLIIWSANELVPFNAEYEVNKYAPGILMFGSNGGGEGFAFDLRQKAMTIVMVPFIGMDLQQAVQIADTFSNFLKKLGDANAELF